MISMGQNYLLVNVVSMQLHLYCFPYELVHAAGYSAEEAGIVEQDLMAGAYLVFHHYQFLWPILLGMMVVFNNPCLDEVTRSRTFAVQVTSFM